MRVYSKSGTYLTFLSTNLKILPALLRASTGMSPTASHFDFFPSATLKVSLHDLVLTSMSREAVHVAVQHESTPALNIGKSDRIGAQHGTGPCCPLSESGLGRVDGLTMKAH